MKLLSSAIVSNSDMIKNYKTCRDKAEEFGTIFIMKNNQPDAVLFSVNEYQRISALIEHLQSLEEKDIHKVIEYLPKGWDRKKFLIDKIQED